MAPALLCQAQHFLLAFTRGFGFLESLVILEHEKQCDQIEASGKYVDMGVTGVDIRQYMNGHDAQQDDVQPDAPRIASFQKERPGQQQEKERQSHCVVGRHYIDGQEQNERKRQHDGTHLFDLVRMPIQIGQKGQTESGETEIDHPHRRAGLPAYEAHQESNRSIEQKHAVQKFQLVSVIPFFIGRTRIERFEFFHRSESLLPGPCRALIILSPPNAGE